MADLPCGIEIGPHSAEALGSRPTSPCDDGIGGTFPNNSSVVGERFSLSGMDIIITLLAKDKCRELIEAMNQQPSLKSSHPYGNLNYTIIHKFPYESMSISI
jgi:hypothetical protein